MGLPQDEILSDALKLAFVAGMLSSSTPRTVPVQMPITLFTPPTSYDFMNHTTTKPLTASNPFQSIPGLTKNLRPLYAAVPLYAIIPLHVLQAQAIPLQWAPSPQPFDSVFWDLVGKTVERSVHGAVALARFLSEIAKATPEKDLASPRDGQGLSSCDLLDLSSLPFIPTEDDLLRVDMSELEWIPSSELYPREVEPVDVAATVLRLLPTGINPPLPLQSGSSDKTLATVLEGFIPGEGFSRLLQIPDEELYFDLDDFDEPGATTPPWPFTASAFIPSTLSSA